jgi:hypothetical protein
MNAGPPKVDPNATYQLRFALTIPPNKEIAATGGPTELDGLVFRFEKLDRQYVRTISGFETGAAAGYLTKMRSGLAELLFRGKVVAEAKYETGYLAYSVGPERTAKSLGRPRPVHE